jgi:hypothetical protein
MNTNQFQQFMDNFTTTMSDVVKELKKDKGKSSASGSSSSSTAVALPKISLSIPVFRGETEENVEVWLRQIKNIMRAQDMKDEGQMIHYAATGFKGAALHWFVNKVKDSTTPIFTSWDDFKKELKTAFQPPHYQQYLRTQLKNLRQTGNVQEYTSQFRNIVSQIDTMGPLDQVAYYIDGLKAATRMEVSYQAPETLDDAWKLAIRYDTAMFGLGRPQMKSNMSRRQQPQRNRGSHSMESDQAETRKSYSSQQRRYPLHMKREKLPATTVGRKDTSLRIVVLHQRLR